MTRVQEVRGHGSLMDPAYYSKTLSFDNVIQFANAKLIRDANPPAVMVQRTVKDHEPTYGMCHLTSWKQTETVRT